MQYRKEWKDHMIKAALNAAARGLAIKTYVGRGIAFAIPAFKIGGQI